MLCCKPVGNQDINPAPQHRSVDRCQLAATARNPDHRTRLLQRRKVYSDDSIHERRLDQLPKLIEEAQADIPDRTLSADLFLFRRRKDISATRKQRRRLYRTNSNQSNVELAKEIRRDFYRWIA